LPISPDVNHPASTSVCVTAGSRVAAVKSPSIETVANPALVVVIHLRIRVCPVTVAVIVSPAVEDCRLVPL
jgi:hypothetical protein